MSFWDLFDPGSSYKKGGEEVQKYYQQMLDMLQPYNQMGQQAGGKMNDAMNNLLDPTKLQNEWASGYEMSPGAKQSVAESNSQGMDAASQMGLLGSSSALSNLQNTSHNLMQGDRDKYMQDLMQKYLAGTGLASSMYGTGANAAGQMGQGAMSAGQQMSDLMTNKQAARNNMVSGLLGQLFSHGMFGSGGGGGGMGGGGMSGGGGAGGGFSGMGGGSQDYGQLMQLLAMMG